MGEKEGTPAWDNTYQLKLHMPPIILCVLHMGLTHVGEDRL